MKLTFKKQEEHTHTHLTCCWLSLGAEGWWRPGRAAGDGICAHFWYFRRTAVIIRMAFSSDLFPVRLKAKAEQRRGAFILQSCYIYWTVWSESSANTRAGVFYHNYVTFIFARVDGPDVTPAAEAFHPFGCVWNHSGSAEGTWCSPVHLRGFRPHQMAPSSLCSPE